MSRWPIGIFTSVGNGLGLPLEMATELGISTIHLYAPAPESRTSEYAETLTAQLDQQGIEITCLFTGFAGESYADIPTVERTVGLVNPDTRVERVKTLQEISDFGKQLNVPAVGFHLGFIPKDTRTSAYTEVMHITAELADYVGENDQNLHLETGQETAEEMLDFLHHVKRENLFVNFDPANMILYGAGEPLPALKTLRDYVRSVHCKDATWSDEPGKTWGEEVPLGSGDVNISEFLKTLDEINYKGPLTIEREIPQEPERQRQDIGCAVDLLSSLKEQY